MRDQLVEYQGHRLWLAAETGPALGAAQDARDLIGEAGGVQADVVVVPATRLSPEFFTLRTGLAGEFIQKLINYGFQFAVLGDISAHVAQSDALRDFVRESNRGRHVFFLDDMDALVDKLGGPTGLTVLPVEIPTPDGVSDGYVVHPGDGGSYPAVIFYMDGIGLRPTLVDLAKGIAAGGYAVLLPNMFYRSGRAPVIDYPRLLAGEDKDAVMAHMRTLIGALTPDVVERDATAFLTFLDARPEALPGPVATTGYCMGGALSLWTAAFHADRVVAAASFHGGKLGTEAPTSPHLLADRITAELYIAHAKDDPSCPAEQVERLEAALQAAGVRHQTEIYEAVHGWTMPDVPWAYQEAAAEKAWKRLYDLLDRTLKA